MVTQKSPYFSVIIPLYNKAPHISRAIVSVLGQEFQDFELIVVDDASTDGGDQVVGNYRDARIRLLHRNEPGPGGYAARNLGISEAQSEWISFLDADDEWYPDHLMSYFKLVENDPSVQFLGSGYRHCFGTIEKYDRFYKINKSSQLKLSFREYLEKSLYAHPFITSVVCARKKLLEDIGMFPAGLVKRGGDADTWLRAIEKAGRFVWSNHLGAKSHRDSVNRVTEYNFYTENEIKQESTKLLIDKYNGEKRTLLKKRFNNVVFYAWNQNMHLNINKNINLWGRLYREVQTIKVLSYEVLSSLPMWIAKPLHRVGYKIVQLKRTVRHQ